MCGVCTGMVVMVSSFNGFVLLMLLCNVEDAGGGAWGKGGEGAGPTFGEGGGEPPPPLNSGRSEI